MDIHANEFFTSILYLSNFCHKANTISFPSVKLHFKTKREYAYFVAQFQKDWQVEMGMPSYGDLTRFQMLGFEIELIIEER